MLVTRQAGGKSRARATWMSDVSVALLLSASESATRLGRQDRKEATED
jgi:hypothetical protein